MKSHVCNGKCGSKCFCGCDKFKFEVGKTYEGAGQSLSVPHEVVFVDHDGWGYHVHKPENDSIKPYLVPMSPNGNYWKEYVPRKICTSWVGMWIDPYGHFQLCAQTTKPKEGLGSTGFRFYLDTGSFLGAAIEDIISYSEPNVKEFLRTLVK